MLTWLEAGTYCEETYGMTLNTEEDCAEIVDEFAADCGFENYVNDREWDLSDN